MNDSIDAYPLQWPLGFKRTEVRNRIRSPFKQTMERSQQFLRKELDRLGAGRLVVSTNIPVRKDGMLYADWMARKLDDPGVAIYFSLSGENVSMCCDQYLSVWENVYALGKSIEALRAIERYGTSDFIKRAFTGFKELPPQPAPKPWWETLGVSRYADRDTIKEAYREKAKTAHPDGGGSDAEFIDLQQAYNQALQ